MAMMQAEKQVPVGGAMPAMPAAAMVPPGDAKAALAPQPAPKPAPTLAAALSMPSPGASGAAMGMEPAQQPKDMAAPTHATRAEAVSCPDLPAPPRSIRRFALSAAPARGALTRTQSLAYNGTAIGPLIRVRRGDIVQVDVTNDGVAGGTTVHWHGQDLPGAAWADGVAAVSQAPIPDGATFSYRFVAEPAGTFWYHSHTGGQYADGLRGPLIVDEGTNELDPNAALYDEDRDDHVLMLADVFRTTSEEQLAQLQRGGMGGAAEDAGVGAAESMMGMPSAPASPSGKMAALCDPAVLNQDISDAPWFGLQLNGAGIIAGVGDKASATMGKPHVITVERGKRYRLRFIGGMSSWAVKVNFTGGHEFDLIALDGRAIAPRRARAVVLTSGERADVVLKADRPVGNYWVDLSTLNGVNSPAILHYKGAPDPFGPAGAAFMRTMRLELPGGCASAVGGQPGLLDLKNATGLVAAAGTPAPPRGPADKAYTIYLADASSSVPPPSLLKHIRGNGSNIHGFNLGNGNIPAKGPSCPPIEASGGGNMTEPSKYCWSLNWNVYEPPVGSVPLILGSPDPSRPAPRTYNIDLAQGDVVDLVLINPSLMVHPMHLHGAGFHVLATGNGLVVDAGDKLVPSKARGFNLVNPPVRDTVPVTQAAPARPAASGATELDPASYGYAVVRFHASNAGPWAFHCHIELHASAGMFLTFTVHPRPKPAGGGVGWALPRNLACAAVNAPTKEQEQRAATAAEERAPAGKLAPTSSSPKREAVAVATMAAVVAALALV